MIQSWNEWWQVALNGEESCFSRDKTMKCKECKKEFTPTMGKMQKYCPECNAEKWAKWEVEHTGDPTAMSTYNDYDKDS